MMDGLEDHLTELFGDVRPELEFYERRGLSIVYLEQESRAMPAAEVTFRRDQREHARREHLRHIELPPMKTLVCARCRSQFTLARRRGNHRRKYCGAGCERP